MDVHVWEDGTLGVEWMASGDAVVGFELESEGFELEMLQRQLRAYFNATGVDEEAAAWWQVIPGRHDLEVQLHQGCSYYVLPYDEAERLLQKLEATAQAWADEKAMRDHDAYHDRKVEKAQQ
jgi:hypothetical protein